ncbi:MAG: hypothetical protein RL491_361 [Bacteroidota bacterium]
MIVIISFIMLGSMAYHIDKHKIKSINRIKIRKQGSGIMSLDNVTLCRVKVVFN